MLRRFFENIENRKIYYFIILITAIFTILVVQNFYYVKGELNNLAEQNKRLIANKMSYITKSWLNNRIDMLEFSVNYINFNYADEKAIQNFFKIYSQDEKYFDIFQILATDYYFYVDGAKIYDYTKSNKYNEMSALKGFDDELFYHNRSWFYNTKNSMKTTMRTMDIHGLLNEKTINLCTPITSDKVFKGVFCGIIKTNSLFKKIGTLSIPEGYYYFISDKKGDILTDFGDAKLIEKSKNEIRMPAADNEDVLIYDLIDLDWYIGVGVDKAYVKSGIILKFLKHSAFIFAAFGLFVIMINVSYSFLFRRADIKRSEYEGMLKYNARLSEIGELVSSINHQLRQPLNALALLIKNTANRLSSANNEDKQRMKNNLDLCVKSIVIMDETLNIFRNFYRTNDTITEFNLKKCVENILHITKPELLHHGITANMDASNIEELKIVSVENFIQQILLVLIQNAKDAIIAAKRVKGFKKSEIEVRFEIQDKNVKIYISDFGEGIKDDNQKNLFSKLKSSAKKSGSGLGLYFAKKLACEKLMGDLELISPKMPTTFMLIVSKNIKDR